MTADRIVRLNINVSGETADDLRRLAAERGTSVTEIVRRAVAVFAYLEAERAEGRQIQTIDRQGRNVKGLVLL
jgi:hypothetical protein